MSTCRQEVFCDPWWHHKWRSYSIGGERDFLSSKFRKQNKERTGDFATKHATTIPEFKRPLSQPGHWASETNKVIAKVCAVFGRRNDAGGQNVPEGRWAVGSPAGRETVTYWEPCPFNLLSLTALFSIIMNLVLCM